MWILMALLSEKRFNHEIAKGRPVIETVPHSESAL